ncbi:hypothetical protein LCGC14_0294340 [marine sediment metagenome]|uniref:Uncharacterized protein n=1 Tax=marine sediment metagenome TaxID=412755 RepID=A0A0F9WY59_9ZZZZ
MNISTATKGNIPYPFFSVSFMTHGRHAKALPAHLDVATPLP